eukprot:169201-Prymnesium_polylepis.2
MCLILAASDPTTKSVPWPFGLAPPSSLQRSRPLVHNLWCRRLCAHTRRSGQEPARGAGQRPRQLNPSQTPGQSGYAAPQKCGWRPCERAGNGRGGGGRNADWRFNYDSDGRGERRRTAPARERCHPAHRSYSNTASARAQVERADGPPPNVDAPSFLSMGSAHTQARLPQSQSQPQSQPQLQPQMQLGREAYDTMLVPQTDHLVLTQGAAPTATAHAARSSISNEQNLALLFMAEPVSYTHLTLPTICSV